MKDGTKIRAGKRIMAAILSLAMVLGIFSGMKLNAEAEGKTYSYDELERGEVKVLYAGDKIEFTSRESNSQCKNTWINIYIQWENNSHEHDTPMHERMYAINGNPIIISINSSDHAGKKYTKFEIKEVNYRGLMLPEGIPSLDWSEIFVIYLVPLDDDKNGTSSESDSTASSSSIPSHICSFQWVTTIDPQVGMDGLEEYKCVECGAVQESRPIPAATESHTCSFQWVTTIEPSVGVDGLEEYMCVGCGVVQESHPIPASVAAVKDFYGKVKDAPANGMVTYDSGKLYTISDYLLKKMSERSDVAVTVNFEYQNAKYELTFPAGTDFTPVLTDEETMYGYFGVAAKLGLTVVTK